MDLVAAAGMILMTPEHMVLPSLDRESSVALAVGNVLAKLPEGCRFYVTIDCDVLDPALAPGNGSPAPGGLDYYELADTLRGIGARGEVIGFDFCEVAPMYDSSGITCQVAARVILDFIGAIFKEKKKRLS